MSWEEGRVPVIAEAWDYNWPWEDGEEEKAQGEGQSQRTTGSKMQDGEKQVTVLPHEAPSKTQAVLPLPRSWLTSHPIFCFLPHITFFSGRKLQLTSGNWSLHIILKQLYWNGKQCFQEKAITELNTQLPPRQTGGPVCTTKGWPNLLSLKLHLIIAWKSSKMTSVSTQGAEGRPESGSHSQEGLPHLAFAGTSPTGDLQTSEYQTGLCGPKSGSERQNVVIPQI